jgi:lipopolysaccharide export system permease protein
MRQLNVDLDSLKHAPDSLYKRNHSELASYVRYSKFKDTIATKKEVAAVKEKFPEKKVNTFDSLIPDSLKTTVFDQTLSQVNNARNLLQVVVADYKAQNDDITAHQIEWHKKLSVSIACLVLFFIGAPLGSIIRKGGLGMPLVMALIFFMIFYLLNIFGEKFTKDHVLIPIVGMWLPVIILSPVGFFLTYKAMHDSQLFNKEYYYRFFKKMRWGLNRATGIIKAKGSA